jgi:hypothetical protein
MAGAGRSPDKSTVLGVECAEHVETDCLLGGPPEPSRRVGEQSSAPGLRDREGGCCRPALSIGHIALILSMSGLLISIVHLCYVIHEDALDERMLKSERFRRSAGQVPSSAVDVLPPRDRPLMASVISCNDLAQLVHYSGSVGRPVNALQSIDFDAIRKSAWASILQSLSNITSEIATQHPDASSPLQLVMAQQNADVRAIRRLKAIQNLHGAAIGSIQNRAMPTWNLTSSSPTGQEGCSKDMTLDSAEPHSGGELRAGLNYDASERQQELNERTLEEILALVRYACVLLC